MNKTILFPIFSLFFLVASLSPCFAATNYWVGSGSSFRWTDKANWSLGVVPSGNNRDTVIFDGQAHGIKNARPGKDCLVDVKVTVATLIIDGYGGTISLKVPSEASMYAINFTQKSGVFNETVDMNGVNRAGLTIASKKNVTAGAVLNSVSQNSGTPATRVATATDLTNVYKNPTGTKGLDNLTSYVQVADIDLASIANFEPYMINNFFGSYRGYGHAIRKLTIKTTKENAGLFGRNAGVIQDLKLVDVDIQGGQGVGGLVGLTSMEVWNDGYNFPKVYHSYVNNVQVSGKVKGDSFVGGVVAYNKGTILRSGFEGTVDATNKRGYGVAAGGFVGANLYNGYGAGSGSNTPNENFYSDYFYMSWGGGGDIIGAYSKGSVTNGAAFAGNNDHTIISSYSIATSTYNRLVGQGVEIINATEQACINAMNSNLAPVLLVPIGLEAAEGAEFKFKLQVNDPDGDVVQIAVTGLPRGASFDPNTMIFSWRPMYDQAGQYDLKFSVKDPSGAETKRSVPVTVFDRTPKNHAPVLNDIPNMTMDEEKVKFFIVLANDIDKDELTYSAVGLPAGASFKKSGAFSWRPNKTQAGTYTITFTVDDGNGGVASKSCTITVRNVNFPPILREIDNPTINEEQVVSFIVLAYDIDKDDLTYSAVGLPAGAHFNAKSGLFSWTPNKTQAGTYTITFTVDDGNRGVTSKSCTITVNNVNAAPVLREISNRTGKEGQIFSFILLADDIDKDELTYSAVGLPAGASFSESGFFHWATNYTQAGTYTIIFTVNDGKGGVASKSCTITVRDALPVLKRPYSGRTATTNSIL